MVAKYKVVIVMERDMLIQAQACPLAHNMHGKGVAGVSKCC
jgi:hypothetical protein